MPESTFGLIKSNSKALAAVGHSNVIDLWSVRAYTRHVLLPFGHSRRERLLVVLLTVF